MTTCSAGFFFNRNVVFTAVMPYKDGKVYYPASSALKTNKLETRLSGESSGIPKEADEDYPICKNLGGFISINDGVVSRYTPGRTAFPHHARPKDKAKAHATLEEGEFYTYEALSEGQTFAGSIVGKAEEVRELSYLFDDCDVLRIGRSRTAQYGKVKIRPLNSVFSSNELSLSNGDTFRLRRLLELELRYCRRNSRTIHRLARYVYNTVVENKDAMMVMNCCDFKKLEAACAEYIKNLPSEDTQVDGTPDVADSPQNQPE